MIVRSAVFETGAVKPAQWPAAGLAEFAFVGRSNVGKSSLLNRLLNRKSLARVSANPGKTQEINFYRINDRFRLVDLPGYGYAAVAKTARERFLKMMASYLEQRDTLVRILHLIDIRHEPTAQDIEMHTWLASLDVPVLVVATKADKVSKFAVKPALQRIAQTLRTPYNAVAVSAEKATGIEALWAVIEQDIIDFEHTMEEQRKPGLDGADSQEKA